jgi:hypothetical protein
MQMFSFELTDVPATLEHFNPRTEKIGPEDIPAADFKIECKQTADCLAFFSPTMRAHLFDTEGKTDLAGGLVVRYPHIDYPIKLDHEMTGARCALGSGVGKPMEFYDSSVNDFRVTPLDGGMVQLVFRVQCKPDEKQAGRLYMLQKRPIVISIEPMELEEELAVIAGVQARAAKPKKEKGEAREEAT